MNPGAKPFTRISWTLLHLPPCSPAHVRVVRAPDIKRAHLCQQVAAAAAPGP